MTFIYRVILLLMYLITYCYADVYTYDGVHVGMTLNELMATKYQN